ncbi:type II secretion system protein [Candidatus Dependentiae bacterium]|nr:type II secretion system protein [Candidatus Dependentiae bacterium]
MKQDHQAFSLIELLISLVLMLFICTMIIPHGHKHAQQQVIQELDRLEALFYSLQQRAMACGLDVQLTCNVAKQSYRYQTLQENELTAFLSQNIRFGVMPGTMGPPWQATEAVQTPITFAQLADAVEQENRIYFFSNGKISSGTIYLCDQGYTVGGALTCAVSQVSSIRKYLYDGKRWKLINSQ